MEALIPLLVLFVGLFAVGVFVCSVRLCALDGYRLRKRRCTDKPK